MQVKAYFISLQLATMNKKDLNDPKSTLRSYYTLAHAMTPRKNSPTHGRSAESGDETDRSVDNDIMESFIMDEINANTESCSLNSSRENLLDSDAGKDSKPNSKPNSRPSSARRASYKGSELPIDERIKVLEEGLKEADMEREVVLSCLGKEYLERITMQNYLQEICSKSGYNYQEIVSNIVTQSGAKDILENIMESRAKALLKTQDNMPDQPMKPQQSTMNRSIKDNHFENNGSEDVLDGKDTDKVFENINKQHVKELLKKFTQAETEKVNNAIKRSHDNLESSHTHNTKHETKLNKAPLGESAEKKNIAGYGCRGDRGENKEGILSFDQSTSTSSKHPWEPYKMSSYGIDKSSEGQNNEIHIERTVLREKPKGDSMTLQLNDKQAKLIMPEKTGNNMMENENPSILRSIELKGLESSEKSIDSIDEGIFMLKNFLQGLQDRNKLNKSVIDKLQSAHGTVECDSSNYSNTSERPRRKLSLNETGLDKTQSDLKPQRRRSYAEGMNMNKRVASDRKAAVVSRLFKPTVASRNKSKEKVPRRDFDSDTESGRQSKEGRPIPLKRSASDVRHGPKRHLYNSYTSAEEDSSVDGEDRDALDLSALQYFYQPKPEISDREYAQLMSILSMLHDQKLKWDSESLKLKENLDEERKLRSDLHHDNGVLRKSLEAANHAIKEINSKVQELKLTIVPLRDENSKLRDQNQGLKAKLDLLRKDKALLMEELQELKQRKQRYEEKFRILGELYDNDKIILAVDNNSNKTANDIEIPKGGLSELLDINIEVSDQEKAAVNRRMGRNRDNSKRHSFHGFEKIDELAGNAEELLAEKEKLEQENETLKVELKEIREKFNREVSTDADKEADIMNRRRGWRMQREESKHRIIREILKTESSQVYGRPYASCTNLTLEDEREELLKDVANAENTKRCDMRNNITDETDAGPKIQLPDARGGASFQIKIERKGKTAGNVSWREESEKIQKRLQNCKFEKPVVKEDIVAKEEAVDYAANRLTNGDEKLYQNDTSAYKMKDKSVYNLGNFSYQTNTPKSYFETDSENWKYQKNSISHNHQSRSSEQNNKETNNARQQKQAEDIIEPIKKENDSFASPQWPIIRDKIQAIYKQPIEILEQSLYERNTQGKRDNDIREQNSTKKYEPTANHDVYLYNQPDDDTVFKHYEPIFGRSKINKASKEDTNHAMHGPQHRKQRNETTWQGTEDETRKADDNWQRKSTSKEITSYEDYRRKLRREELENAYLISHINRNSNDKDVRLQNENNQEPINAKSNHNGRVLGTNSTPDLTLVQRKGQNHYEVKTKVMKVENKVSDRRNTVTPDSSQWSQRDTSPWVPVPVYLKTKGEPSNQQTSTPKGHFRKVDGNKVSNKDQMNKSNGRKMIEETINSVESAFSSVKPATGKTASNKGSKGHSRDFVRQSPGTVMYLDEIADSDSGSSSEAPIPRRRSKSLRRARPKSDIFTDSASGNSSFGNFRRNRSLRMPKKTKDDMFSVDIYFEGESQDDSAIQLHSQSFTESSTSTIEQEIQCQHQKMHQLTKSQQSLSGRLRIQSETGTNMTRSSTKRSKSPGGFSCEMCREMSKKKNAQERYCWEKYFPIGETTIETRVIKEDYV